MWTGAFFRVEVRQRSRQGQRPGDGVAAFEAIGEEARQLDQEDFRIEVEFLPRDQAYPVSPSPHDRAPWPPGDWSSETSHLNKVLAS